MYFTLTASKDTYITNKIISNTFSASDANVGRASTLDFFKLYDESSLSGTINPIEISRTLIKFDFERIKTLLSQTLNLNGNDFRCYLKLYDIMGGQMTPTNFTISLFPLSQSFDEGIGRNVVSFADIGAANFYTASYSNSSNVLWYMSGANKMGDIDVTATPVASTADEFTFSGVGTEDGTIELISFDGNAAFTTKTYKGIAGSTSGEVQADGAIAFDTGGSIAGTTLGLKTAIESTDGHDGKITATRGNQAVLNDSVTLAQAVAGIEGDTAITVGGSFNDACSTNPPAAFTGGVSNYPTNIDLINSGNLNDGDGKKGLESPQIFVDGSADLRLNVTTIVSATIAGILPDAGWRLSFTGSEENDTKTRFVKRFASRHVRDKYIRPRLEVIYDDTIKDQNQSLFFDLTGSVFLKNFHRGMTAHILSGGFSNTQVAVTGTDCIMLKIQSGSFKKYVSASAHQAGTRWYNHKTSESYNYVTGVYSASFAVSSLNSGVISGSIRVMDYVKASGSLTFDAIWGSPDRTVSYLTSSLTIKRSDPTSFNIVPTRLDLIVTNARSLYKATEKAFFRVFVKDFKATEKKAKLPYSIKSVILEEVYYRVKDAENGKVWIPFTQEGNGTRLSSDSEGMFFELYMDTLAVGRTYNIDFLVKDSGIELIQEAKNVRFTTE